MKETILLILAVLGVSFILFVGILFIVEYLFATLEDMDPIPYERHAGDEINLTGEDFYERDSPPVVTNL